MKTENQPMHTQGEWKVEPTLSIVSDIHTGYILCTVNDRKNGVGLANANRIVTAVNEYDSLKKKSDMHDELVEFVVAVLRNIQVPHTSKEAFLLTSAKKLLKQVDQK